MKINGKKINFFSDIIPNKIKSWFHIKPSKLERQPETDTFVVNVFENTSGIKSNTFKTLLSPEFTPKTNLHESGAKITTLIDKKTQKPVEALVAKVEDNGDDSIERFWIMVKDNNGEINLGDENFKVVGSTYFQVNKKEKMITPKSELTIINGELYEKVLGFMRADGNKEFGGIGTRLHQIRVERMLQNGLGNVRIVAEGNSFPFHFGMGYRLQPNNYKTVEDAARIMSELTFFSKKPARQNAQYIIVEKKDGKQVINFSKTLENCLNDYYQHGGEAIEDFSPNMFLDKTSLEQWIEMIKKQPILY